MAKEVLRVDLSLLSNRRAEPEDDPRLLVKSLAPKTPATASQMQEVSHSVICDLLNFLVHADGEESEEIAVIEEVGQTQVGMKLILYFCLRLKYIC